LAFPLLVFYFVYRCARDSRYWRHFTERLGAGPGSFQPTPPGSIWLHAVSVGEVISSAGLLEQLRDRSPTTPLYVSVGTVAGRAIAVEKLSSLVDGIFYAPIDYAFAVRRVLRGIRPSVVVILETEIWPVLYREVKRAGCALLILNGRISDRAFPRYRWWRFLFRSVLEWPDAIFTQSEQDRARYLELGAPESTTGTLGNLKYDAAPLRSAPPQAILDAIAKLNPSAIWIAASTMPPSAGDDPDEDDIVLRSFQEVARTHPGLLLILAPRRPERFAAAEQRLQAAQIPYQRRSDDRIDANLALPCVLLLDTIGELSSLFPLADVVFMGGTLAQRGGHNLLEPAACERAIIVGPHMENFAAIAEEFRRNDALYQIRAASELSGAVQALIENSELRQDLGARAAQVAAHQRGATRKAVAAILQWHDLTVPAVRTQGLGKWLLWPLAQLWIARSNAKQRRDVARARRLDTPVVSIGGIAIGGSGKTPMVDYLAERLRQRGHHSAILTRGYRRRSIEPAIVIEAGEAVPVSVTGDEAQIFVHSGHAHAGIGADRWSTGRVLEQKYNPDVFLLDDGFQHRRLARDLDIVLIDALDPLGGGAVFPLGRMREPLSGLARAGAFVIMRAAPDREYRGLRNQLHALNPGAPVFRAMVEPRYWVNHRTERLAHPPQGPVAAFCGLANPASFWGTLKTLRIDPVFRWVFGDHHRYRWNEITRLAAQARMHGASVLLCTEKDAMNLPERSMELLLEASVEVYWLKIGIQVENEEAFIELIEATFRS
jgi:3-deoxy-D-manno-octulosonic-acid transferase